MFVLLIVIGAQFFCGMSSVTANSRMIYAFSRDGAVPGQLVLAPDQQAHPHADELDLAGGRRRVHPRPAVPVQPGRLRGRHLDRGHRAVRRLHRAGLPAAAGRRQVRAGTVEPGPLEPADRDRGDDLGRLHLHPVHAAAGRTRSRSRRSTTRRSSSSSSSAARRSGTTSRPRTGSRGRRVQGTAEELAPIERDLEVI